MDFVIVDSAGYYTPLGRNRDSSNRLRSNDLRLIEEETRENGGPAPLHFCFHISLSGNFPWKGFPSNFLPLISLRFIRLLFQTKKNTETYRRSKLRRRTKRAIKIKRHSVQAVRCNGEFFYIGMFQALSSIWRESLSSKRQHSVGNKSKNSREEPRRARFR